MQTQQHSGSAFHLTERHFLNILVQHLQEAGVCRYEDLREAAGRPAVKAATFSARNGLIRDDVVDYTIAVHIPLLQEALPGLSSVRLAQRLRFSDRSCDGCGKGLGPRPTGSDDKHEGDENEAHRQNLGFGGADADRHP